MLLSPARLAAPLGDPHLVKAFIHPSACVTGFLPAMSSCLLVWSRDRLLDSAGPFAGVTPLPAAAVQTSPALCGGVCRGVMLTAAAPGVQFWGLWRVW